VIAAGQFDAKLVFLGLIASNSLAPLIAANPVWAENSNLHIAMGKADFKIDLLSSLYIDARRPGLDGGFFRKPVGVADHAFLIGLAEYQSGAESLRPQEINFSLSDDCWANAKGQTFCANLSGMEQEDFFLSGRFSLRPLPDPTKSSPIQPWLNNLRKISSATDAHAVDVVMGSSKDGLRCEAWRESCEIWVRIDGEYLGQLPMRVRRRTPAVAEQSEQLIRDLINFYIR
jgi:hypothetical protein